MMARWTFAVAEAIGFWRNHEIPYMEAEIERGWYEKFLVEWRVARTIRKGTGEDVRALLNRRLLAVRDSDDPAGLVEEVADALQKRGYGAKGGRPISLVSKVGYFLRPKDLTPRDRFVLRGLNCRRREDHLPPVRSGEYTDFVGAFNQEFSRAKEEIAAECRQSWARALVRRFGLDPRLLNTTLFQRKVLDNMLMAKGGRWPGPGDSEDEAG
jgi:hypothetical protein